MDTIPISSNASATQVTDKSSLALDSEDFLKIMITELTHQDPLDPMKNQDLHSKNLLLYSSTLLLVYPFTHYY